MPVPWLLQLDAGKTILEGDSGSPVLSIDETEEMAMILGIVIGDQDVLPNSSTMVIALPCILPQLMDF